MGVNAFIWMYMCSITVWLDVSPAHNIARPVGSTFPLLGQLGHELLKVGRIIAGRSVPTHIIGNVVGCDRNHMRTQCLHTEAFACAAELCRIQVANGCACPFSEWHDAVHGLADIDERLNLVHHT